MKVEFTEQDLNDAIERGIFTKNNEVTANPSEIIRYFEAWAELECKKIHRNVRHEACEILNDHLSRGEAHNADIKIMNIKF